MNEYSESAEFEDDDFKSKTQVKNELKDITQLGMELADMGMGIIKKLPLNETTIEAFLELDNIRGNEARKRHFKRIGKLLREQELDDVKLTLEQIRMGQSIPKPKTETDQWLQRLLEEGVDSETFMQAYPDSDRQQLRQLLRNALKSPKKSKDKLRQFLQSICG